LIRRFVVDSSPLILLHRISQLDLLPGLAEVVAVPRTVVDVDSCPPPVQCSRPWRKSVSVSSNLFSPRPFAKSASKHRSLVAFALRVCSSWDRRRPRRQDARRAAAEVTWENAKVTGARGQAI
jgi:hypothetical protein